MLCLACHVRFWVRTWETYLGSDGWVELVGEEVVAAEVVRCAEWAAVEVVEEPLQLDPVDVGGASHSLGFGGEEEELVGTHVVAAIGVGLEGLLHLRRQCRLSPPEAPSEAKTILAAPHDAAIRLSLCCSRTRLH